MMSIWYEDRFGGISNYLPWKVRITALLKEWKIWNFANTKMMNLTNKDDFEEHESLEDRAHIMIIDGVNDHSIPHLEEK